MVRRGKRETEPSLRRALAWAAITFAMAGAAGGTGYLVAATTGAPTAGSPSASAAPKAMPKLLRASDIYATGRRAGGRAARPRALAAGRRQGRMLGRVAAGAQFRPGEPAYRRIFEAGRRTGTREALAGFAGDGLYVVRVSRGGRRATIGRGPLGPRQTVGRGRLGPRATSARCDGGTRACLDDGP